jgi:hypothetical protein
MKYSLNAFITLLDIQYVNIAPTSNIEEEAEMSVVLVVVVVVQSASAQ